MTGFASAVERDFKYLIITGMSRLFISHASEDKNEIARPLAQLLKAKKVDVWFDEYELKVGDSLRRSIDKGLHSADYGLVILSSSFFNKQWTEYELDSLVSLERSHVGKKILPVWHQLEIHDIMRYSPYLADKIAAKTNFGLEKVVEDILKAINIGSNNDQAFHNPDPEITVQESLTSSSIKEVVELLKYLKKTKFLWMGLCELSSAKEMVEEEIKEMTFLSVKASLDKMLLSGLLFYETKRAYNTITTGLRFFQLRSQIFPLRYKI